METVAAFIFLLFRPCCRTCPPWKLPYLARDSCADIFHPFSSSSALAFTVLCFSGNFSAQNVSVFFCIFARSKLCVARPCTSRHWLSWSYNHLIFEYYAVDLQRLIRDIDIRFEIKLSNIRIPLVGVGPCNSAERIWYGVTSPLL